ncbi:hypothetical protein O2K51_12360 [Apibacter raozihei]|uniref:hypothetical protein n=1 Tax=Apibacter raozihei TaxID=2500547 RepID=UPI000FE38140|nr:hypothetical protein [Apibacter raozihei]
MLKFYNKIIAGTDHAVAYQSAALLLFVLFFIGMTYVVMKKPKDYYKDMSDMPLEEEENKEK